MSQPRFPSGTKVTGSHKDKLQWKRENKRRRQHQQIEQPEQSYWTHHDGSHTQPVSLEHPSQDSFRGGMCPSNLALQHPAAPILKQYATKGCPVDPGRHWSRDEVRAAVAYGSHPMEDSASKQFWEEAVEKQSRGLVSIIDWEEIDALPDEKFPRNMKVSPLSAVPHKSRGWRAILDLSWMVKFQNSKVPSVNGNSTKLAPRGSMDQIGHTLQRLIHAVATAPDGKNVYFAKWDVKDGFWQMVAEEGAEWNFCYLIKDPEGNPKIVKPSSLQMGFIDSPGFFGTASETARDVAQQYAQAPMGTLPKHKFEHYTQAHEDYRQLPTVAKEVEQLLFTLEVYVDDFIGACVADSQEHLDHVGRAALHGIHDVFPPTVEEASDPNSVKKLKKGDGSWQLDKDLLGFDFNGEHRTIIVDEAKREALLGTLRAWTRLARERGSSSAARVEFVEFRKKIAQLRHVAICIPSGKGLLSESSRLASMEGQRYVFIRVGSLVYQELHGWLTLLREATAKPTHCKELVSGHPDIVGIVDASKEGVGGIVVGENEAVIPFVFRLEWPQEVRDLVISDHNPDGKITNSDLECAGALLLWLVIERVVPNLAGKHVALLNDNSPTVSWLTRLTSTRSRTAAALLRILSMRLKLARASPLIPMHIAGEQNAISDIPSRSFGGKAKWHCKTDREFLTLFNSTFPLPQQNCWTLFHLPKESCTRVISVLLTQASEPQEWRRLSKQKASIFKNGVSMSNLWEWTLGCRSVMNSTSSRYEPSLALQQESSQASMASDARSVLHRSVQLSRPLVRRFPWTGTTTR